MIEKPIPVERLAKPASGHVAWLAAPKASPITQCVKAGDQKRAREAIEREIRADGFDPADCHIEWTVLENGWGWTARVRE